MKGLRKAKDNVFGRKEKGTLTLEQEKAPTKDGRGVTSLKDLERR